MDTASDRRRPTGTGRREGWWTRLAAVALLAATLTVAATAEAGGRHHGRHHGGEGAAWFALGSMLAFLAVAHTHPPRIVHSPRHHRWHAHGHRPHDHGAYRHRPAHRLGDHRHGAYRHRHGHRDGRHRHVHRRAAPAPLVLSDRHRHGSGAWHVHSLDRPRAFHRH